ncbi:MAG: hypothetical protein Q8Q09_07185 [Deltaproteobacteria bacterium]|nr:hypothetical protein [Deltaproteobacteria bacterium]
MLKCPDEADPVITQRRTLLAAWVGALLLILGIVSLVSGMQCAEKLRLFRLAIAESGPARTGLRLSDEDLRERVERLARASQIRVTDVTVTSEEVEGLPAALAHSAAGAALESALRVQSRRYEVRGQASACHLWRCQTEPLHARLVLRESVTMSPSLDPGAAMTPPLEPPAVRGME